MRIKVFLQTELKVDMPSLELQNQKHLDGGGLNQLFTDRKRAIHHAVYKMYQGGHTKQTTTWISPGVGALVVV